MDLEERRLQFTLYPEGGSLVAGVENRVAFEAAWNVKLCSAPGPDRRKTARCCGMNESKKELMRIYQSIGYIQTLQVK